jgi:hypothetical protein
MTNGTRSRMEWLEANLYWVGSDTSSIYFMTSVKTQKIGAKMEQVRVRVYITFPCLDLWQALRKGVRTFNDISLVVRIR